MSHRTVAEETRTRPTATDKKTDVSFNFKIQLSNNYLLSNMPLNVPVLSYLFKISVCAQGQTVNVSIISSGDKFGIHTLQAHGSAFLTT